MSFSTTYLDRKKCRCDTKLSENNSFLEDTISQSPPSPNTHVQLSAWHKPFRSVKPLREVHPLRPPYCDCSSGFCAAKSVVKDVGLDFDLYRQSDQKMALMPSCNKWGVVVRVSCHIVTWKRAYVLAVFLLSWVGTAGSGLWPHPSTRLSTDPKNWTRETGIKVNGD